MPDPASRPALIACDLDGTLLGSDGGISDRNAAAIDAAAAAGIVVIAATGRSRLTALDRLAPCPAVRWAVCSNGAMTWDRGADAMAVHRPIDGTVASTLMHDLADLVGPGIAFAWETGEGFGYDPGFLGMRPDLGRFGSLAPARPAPTEQITKILACHRDLAEDDLRRLLVPMMPDAVVATSSGGALVEITAAGVDKASGVGAVAARLGIDRSAVMAFGDQCNDLALLRWAGTGIAMANAHPDVIARADRVTAANVDDGVAVVIESLLD